MRKGKAESLLRILKRTLKTEVQYLFTGFNIRILTSTEHSHGNVSHIVESSPEFDPKGSASSRKRTVPSSFKTPTAAPRFNTPTAASEKFNPRSNVNGGGKGSVKVSKDIGYKSSEKGGKLGNSFSKSNKRAKPQGARAVEVTNSDDDYDCDSSPERNVTELPGKSSELPKPQSGPRTLSQLEQENNELRERLDKKEEVFLLLQKDLRRERELRKTLEAEVTSTF
jgi:hypothetical protein